MNQPDVLALDIACGAACACVIRQDGIIFSGQSASDKPHSQAIMPMLERLLDESGLSWCDLNLLACGIGPGSFTGLRIAAATIAGINCGLSLPVLEISSLAIGAAQLDYDDDIHIIEDARGGRAYVGLYRNHAAIEPDRCLTWDHLVQLPAGIYSGQQEKIMHLQDWRYITPQIPRPQAMARLLTSMISSITGPGDLPFVASPVYINPSQAERNARTH